MRSVTKILVGGLIAIAATLGARAEASDLPKLLETQKAVTYESLASGWYYVSYFMPSSPPNKAVIRPIDAKTLNMADPIFLVVPDALVEKLRPFPMGSCFSKTDDAAWEVDLRCFKLRKR